MNGRVERIRDWLYIGIGTLNLLIALMITLGGLFSSFAFGFGMGLLVDLPIALGLAGVFQSRRPFTLFMTFGCTMIVIYITVATYFTIKSGYPMLPFHMVWVSLSLIQVTLSLFRFRQLRQRIEVTPWPH